MRDASANVFEELRGDLHLVAHDIVNGGVVNGAGKLVALRCGGVGVDLHAQREAIVSAHAALLRQHAVIGMEADVGKDDVQDKLKIKK